MANDFNQDQKTYWEIFQQEKYGNVIDQQTPIEDETAQKFTDWMRNGEESLLLELENNYPL